MNERQLYSAWSDSEREHYRQNGYWVDQPLGEQLRQWAIRQPTSIALVAGKQHLSYAGLDSLADRLAAGLAARGIRSQDNVLLQLPKLHWPRGNTVRSVPSRRTPDSCHAWPESGRH
ncbi:iron aquisition 2,3-dihydroxybenzoate-AMP ligase [Klebsiella pneumoniae]|uniref:Iron aquisition 2,3-dihydroxybenzoate-AMP ligase n=1 Tax=Klebsiella pneumoniae TaxID=573 RepID=A0A378F0X7_KLEPN|nr:iron aquisition 2,3-dihydroxybenzoate-AMP ligase [Klebsiella pneumoniae]